MLNKKYFKRLAPNTTQKREELLRTILDFDRGEPLKALLLKTDFCKLPASTSHHGSYEGGLFDHCLGIYLVLKELEEFMQDSWFKEYGGEAIVAFCHDLCKIDAYVREDDSWDCDGFPTGYHYVHNTRIPLICGHGSKSVIIAQSAGVKLTEEEIACIRYHMGAYETKEWDYFGEAIKKYPSVLYTHTADMHVSKILGV